MERNDHCWCPPDVQPGESWKAINLISGPLLRAPKNQESEQTKMPTTSNFGEIFKVQVFQNISHQKLFWPKLCQSFIFFQIALRRSQKSPKMVHWGDDRHSSSIGHGCRRKAVDSFGTFSVILRAMQCAFLKQWKTMQNPPRQRGWKSVLLFCCPMPVTACALLRKRGMKSNLTNTR